MTGDIIDTLVATIAPRGDSVGSGVWQRVDTTGLPDLITNEQCALWLFRNLKRKGLFDAVEPGFRHWLEKRALRVVATNQLVDAERDRVAGILNAAAIPFVLLKGSARRLVAAEIPFADARPMMDVDVLVSHADLQAAWDALVEAGFARTSELDTTPDDWLHMQPLCSGDGVSVELHDRTQKNLTPDGSWERVARNARRVEVDGLVASVPNTTELFWHTLYHALYHSADGFKLRFLLDGVSLLADPTLDLDVVEQRIVADEAGCRPHGARAWMDCVRWLDQGGGGEDSGRYGLKPFLRWSLTVFRRFPLRGRVGARVVAEARRAEMRLERAPYVVGSPPLVRLRRSLGVTAAAGAYRIWRLGQRRR